MSEFSEISEAAKKISDAAKKAHAERPIDSKIYPPIERLGEAEKKDKRLDEGGDAK